MGSDRTGPVTVEAKLVPVERHGELGSGRAFRVWYAILVLVFDGESSGVATCERDRRRGLGPRHAS
jgi:hypothetical protein